MRPTLLFAGALSCALSMAGCTPDQEQTTLNGLQVACAALPVGTQIAIQVASAIPGGAGAAAVAGTVQGVGGAACGTLIPAAQALINGVNATGATAVVTATTTDPTSGKRTVRRMSVAPGGKVIFTGTVAPSSVLGF